MKLLLDQGVPRLAATTLREAGLDAVHVGEMGLARASDAEILAHARRIGAVVVTHDSDFHSLLAASGDSNPSVIRLRDERLRHDGVCSVLTHVVARHGAELASGAAISIRGRLVRVRQLPFVRPVGD